VNRRIHLSHTALQDLLAVAAIATAVSLPVVLLSVGGGVSSHERSALESSGFEITVSAPGTHGVGNSHALTREIDNVPNVAAASPALSSAVDLFGPTGVREPALAEGVLPGPFLATLSPAERSAFPSPLPLGDPGDTIHFANGTYDGPATNEILLAGPTASALGVGVGGTIGVSDDANATTTMAYTVTGEFGTPSGVLGPIAGFAVIVPLSDLQVLTGEARANGTSGALLDASDTVEVSLVGAASSNPGDVQAAANAIQALVPYYGITTLSDQVVELNQADSVLTGFYLALSATAIVIGLLFLTLVLLRRVEAERRSIGIRRAIGLPPWTIATGLVGRAAAIASTGVLVGTGGGWLVLFVLLRFGSGEVPAIAALAVFDPRTLAELGVGTVLLCLLASGAAARAALRLPLAEALR
jgi:putative ABC transport system permease protein